MNIKPSSYSQIVISKHKLVKHNFEHVSFPTLDDLPKLKFTKNKKPDVLLYSQYFILEDRDGVYYNYISYFIHLLVVYITLYISWSQYAFLNIYSVDCSFYFLQYVNTWFSLGIDRHVDLIKYSKRMVFIVMISGLMQMLYFILPLKLTMIMTFLVSLPRVMVYFVDTKYFIREYKKILGMFEEFGYFLISKQMAKILNVISKECFDLEPNFNHGEFSQLVRNFSQNTILNFLGAFLVASLLNYFENEGVTIYTMLFRQYYFSEYIGSGERFKDDTEYLQNMLVHRKWSKLLEPLTLNKLINHYLKQDTTGKNIIAENINSGIEFCKNTYLQTMCCWIVHGLELFNGAGILTNIIFISGDKVSKICKLLVVMAFYIINMFTNEGLLTMLLCNLTILLLVNRISFSIGKDIMKKVGLAFV